MSILENFQNLFIEIWQQGIAGINFTQIGLGIVILLLFLLLRGLISSFILKRLENYVAKTSNKFDDALVKASKGPVKFLPIHWVKSLKTAHNHRVDFQISLLQVSVNPRLRIGANPHMRTLGVHPMIYRMLNFKNAAELFNDRL